MYRVLFIIPGLGLKVHSFSLMLLLACFAAFRLAARRARRERLDPIIIDDLAVWLFVGGLLGARALFVLQNPGAIHGWVDVVSIWRGGIVFYGCILGGLAGSLLLWVRRPFPFLATADAVAPALALGIVLGRIGCFLNGCCYGSPCDRPWAVRFPAGTFPWAAQVQAGLISPGSPLSLPVHPKQLYLALAGLALLGLLWAYYPRRRRDGEVMALLMIAYPVTRFLTEFFRGDVGGLYAGLTISQYISMGLLAGGLVAWHLLPRQPAGRHADAARADDPARGAAPASGRARGPRPAQVADAGLPGGGGTAVGRSDHRA
jgi:phosphatidylglycerol:prolipoprotein diacylglycerol transferase